MNLKAEAMTTNKLDDLDDAAFDSQFKLLQKSFELIGLQKAGDIILVRPESKWYSRVYQALCLPSSIFKRGSVSRIPSHVLIVIAPGLYLHSMPRSGVRTIKAEDYPLWTNQLVEVYRHHLAKPEGTDFGEKITESASWHYAQSYNYKINATRWQRKYFSHSYCSQLVASIYERAGMYEFMRPSRLVLPIHLADELHRSPDWHEVTADYRRFEELLHDEQLDIGMLDAHRGTANLLLTLPHDSIHALQNFHRSLSRRERLLGVYDFLLRGLDYIGKYIGNRSDAAESSNEIDINDFFRPLVVVGLASNERSTSTKNWREENQREAARRVSDAQQRYLQFCETALTYCFAVSVLLTQCAAGTVDKIDRLIEAVSFHEEVVDAIRSHEFTRMKLADIPASDAQIYLRWSIVAVAFVDLLRIRNALSTGRGDLRGIIAELGLELPLTDQWIKNGAAVSSVKHFNQRSSRLLSVFLSDKIKLVSRKGNPSESICAVTAPCQ